MKKILATCSGIMALGLIFLVPQSEADSITYSIGVGNPDISVFSGPYASVVLDRSDSTHATITFTALSNGTQTFFLGGQGAVGFNLNGTASSVLTPGTNPTGGAGGPLDPPKAGTEDGFGTFTSTIDSFDGFGKSNNQVTIALTATGATSWASVDDVLTPNTSGWEVAAHIFAAVNCGTTTGCENNGTPGITGYATGAPVPEPATMLLVGSLLSGLGVFGRKKFISIIKD